jgi:hypothetical protein
MKNKDYLTAAAKAAAEQLADNAALYVPLDPNVADLMGAFHICRAKPRLLLARSTAFRS